MEKRHSDTLTNRLEHVLDGGCVYILWNELRRWYEVKKVAAGTYRDIAERWNELSEGKDGPLQTVQGYEGFYLFAKGAISPFPSE